MLIVKCLSINSKIFTLDWVPWVPISSHNEYLFYLLVYLEYLIMLDSINFIPTRQTFSYSSLSLYASMNIIELYPEIQ